MAETRQHVANLKLDILLQVFGPFKLTLLAGLRKTINEVVLIFFFLLSLMTFRTL